MFLRKDRDRAGSGHHAQSTPTFHLEISVRRRSLGHDLISELRKDRATLTVDGISHNLADLVSDRKYTIHLENPSFGLRARISVPEQWQRNVGSPEDGEQAFIFTSEFGPNGGRRLSYGASLHAGFDYYVVARPSILRALQSCFDIAIPIGEINSSRSNLLVVRIVTLWNSPNRTQADFWLADHGFRLTSLDLDPVPIWPPQLRSNGIDEPLFSNSQQIYQTPFASRNENPVHDDIDFPRLNCDHLNPRRVGLLGFAPHGRVRSQIEGECCFLRANRHLPWSAYVLSHTYPEGLMLADAPHLPSSDEQPHASSTALMPELAIKQTQCQILNKHLDIEQRRLEQPQHHGIPLSVSLARIRSTYR
ncbi:hypothetical protein [Bifidobacterium animalis]|uniref:hypothetical protein n=1 Tax=Bifidobacterium animalis TaxID=28025 RepID=UPI001F4CD30F|nr:hypothetical protein [Bifidobacterium animalis]